MARAAQPRPPRPLAEHLTANAFAIGAGTAFVLAVVAALATSRSNGHVLSPAGVIAIVIGVAAAVTVTGWINGLYAGADDVITERITFACAPGCPSEPATDPWEPGRLWRSAALVAVVSGLWAGATAGFVAVVLDAARAPFAVLCATLIGTVGLAAVVVDIAARHRGAHAARAFLRHGAAPGPLRQRAWRQVAVPLGALNFAVNSAATWMLFHDYTAADGPRALTGAVVAADLPVIAIIAAAYLGVMAGGWGRIDATLGRVTLDDPAAQTVDRRMPIGPQALVYVAIAAIVVGDVVAFFVPGRPSLLTIAIVRGAFAAFAAFLAAGTGYVRGAVNTISSAPPAFSPSGEHRTVSP